MTVANKASRFVLVTLLGLFAAQARGQTMSPADIKALLARIREERAIWPSMQADFQEQRKIHLLDEPITSSGKVWFQAPNKFRLERKGNSPSITVSDGQALWIYYPKFKSAERYSLGKRSPLDAAITTITTALNLQEVENSFHIAGAKTDAGYDLELMPRNPSMKRIFQKLSLHLNNDLFAERTDMLQPNGDRIITTYANPAHAALPPSTFAFTPPPGTDITTPLGK
jgi:outer membrane lipoprotein-sorting protein